MDPPPTEDGPFSSWQAISVGELEIKEQIGTGLATRPQFGVVYRGYCRSQEVAIKKLKKFVSDPRQKDIFIREASAMSAVRHPHIVSLLGVCTDTEEWMMVQEFCARGDLESLLHNPKIKISLLKKIRFAIDICMGMNWLNGEHVKVQHQDLKPANVLVDKGWNCKIADFGLSILYNASDEKAHNLVE